MIRIGIVGTQLRAPGPASGLSPRSALRGGCAVRAAMPARTAALAARRPSPTRSAIGGRLVERADIDAVAIATPPRLQPEIAIAALEHGKPVFIEKPMAADLAGAAAMLRQRRHAADHDGFQLHRDHGVAKGKGAAGCRARSAGCGMSPSIGMSRTASTRLRLKNWKTSGDDGGGALGNFVSHSLHYLEWFVRADRRTVGAAVRIARRSGVRDQRQRSSLAFQSGAAGSFAMSCASYLGTGHRLEFYGEDGTLVLTNPTPDYMRGFSREPRPAARPQRSRRSRSTTIRSIGSFPPRPHRAGVAAGQPLPRRDRTAPPGDARLCRRLSRAGACSMPCADRIATGSWIELAPEVAHEAA